MQQQLSLNLFDTKKTKNQKYSTTLTMPYGEPMPDGEVIIDVEDTIFVYCSVIGISIFYKLESQSQHSYFNICINRDRFKSDKVRSHINNSSKLQLLDEI